MCCSLDRGYWFQVKVGRVDEFVSRLVLPQRRLDSLPSSPSSVLVTMSFPPGMPPPPPGMPAPPPGMPIMPPPGMPAQPQASTSKMPREQLAQKSQKWIQMQNKRYGEKRKGGYVDMGKQVRTPSLHFSFRSDLCGLTSLGFAPGARPQNYQRPWRHEQPQVQERQARPSWGA